MTELQIKTAQISDLADIVSLLSDDVLGQRREGSNMSLYNKGLTAIIEDELNDFFVALLDNKIVGCFQVTVIPSLSRGASKRALIESVRIDSALRGGGLGRKMMQWAIEFSKSKGCCLVQLTTDKTRFQAHKFYLNLGFIDSHIGMKLMI